MSDTLEIQDADQPLAPARRGRPSKAGLLAGQDPAMIEAEMALDQHLAEIEHKYGDDLPFDQHRVEEEVKFYLGQSVHAYFESGKRLIRLKEHVGHGRFMESLARLGLEYEVAKKTMFTVRKFVETGMANRETFTTLSPSKLFEIALLEPEDIEELGAGGTIAGKTLDDIEKMTVREIKATLRKEREDRKARDESREGVIKAKNEKIDELERQLRGTPDRSPREKAQFELYDYRTRFVAKCHDLRETMRSMHDLLADAARIPGVEIDQIRQFANQLIDLGTEVVIGDWEVLTDAVTNLMPTSEVKDVQALG